VRERSKPKAKRCRTVHASVGWNVIVGDAVNSCPVCAKSNFEALPISAPSTTKYLYLAIGYVIDSDGRVCTVAGVPTTVREGHCFNHIRAIVLELCYGLATSPVNPILTCLLP